MERLALADYGVTTNRYWVVPLKLQTFTPGPCATYRYLSFIAKIATASVSVMALARIMGQAFSSSP